MAGESPLAPLIRLPLAGQLGVSIGMAAAILGGFWYLYYSGKSAEAEAKDAQLAKLQQEIRNLEATAARLDEFRRRVELRRAQLEKLKQVLPSQRQTPDLIRKVNSMASESSLTIVRFNPRATVPREFHDEWPIDMTVEGTYHNLGMFFDRVSRLSRLVNMMDVKIRAQRAPTATRTITATCVATTYVFKDEAATAQAAAATAQAAQRGGGGR
jgi:type IV pilus assembly protein PilO